MTPGRSTAARSPNASRTARSQPALSRPYRTPRSASGASTAVAGQSHGGDSSVTGSAGQSAYAAIVETNTYRPARSSSAVALASTSAGT